MTARTPPPCSICAACGTAYAISLTDGIWVARCRNNPTRVLAADTAPELRWLLRADHGQWPRTGT